MSTDTLESRLDRIESALASKLNLNLDDFDPHDVKQARADRLALAGEQAAELVKQAFVEPELTSDQRLERISRALGIA